MLPVIAKSQNCLSALVIEPARLYQGIYTHILEGANFQVTIAATGDEALQLLQSEEFNLLCLSLQLPDISGTLLCAKLRAIPTTMNIPIVMISSDENNTGVQRALVSGATEVFHKNELKAFSTYLEHFIDKVTSGKFVYGRILYIEDQMSTADVTSQLLEGAGYTVSHFTTAKEAFDELLKASYDLILTDIMLEGTKTGYTLIREIQKLPGRYSEIPVLAMSGISDIQRKIELLKSGVSDYIQKPVLDEELLARVHNLVHMRHLLDQVEQQRIAMRDLAMHDQLTKLYNRHYLMELGPKKILEAHRHNIPVSLFMIDVDHFKKINDTYGHAIGDMVLASVAKTLDNLSRGEDICARFGGEEFVMLLSHCDDESAMAKAELIRAAIEDMELDGMTITVSVGVSTSLKNNDTEFDALFELADKAVYRAKEAGRNRVEAIKLE